jgi:hypothetical protein
MQSFTSVPVLEPKKHAHFNLFPMSILIHRWSVSFICTYKRSICQRALHTSFILTDELNLSCPLCLAACCSAPRCRVWAAVAETLSRRGIVLLTFRKLGSGAWQSNQWPIEECQRQSWRWSADMPTQKASLDNVFDLLLTLNRHDFGHMPQHQL